MFLSHIVYIHCIQVPGGNTEAIVEIWIQEISVTSNSKFSMDFYLSEMWLDPALQYEHLNPCHLNISLSSAFLDRIWTPNAVFINSKWHQLMK